MTELIVIRKEESGNKYLKYRYLRKEMVVNFDIIFDGTNYSIYIRDINGNLHTLYTNEEICSLKQAEEIIKKLGFDIMENR